MRLCLTVVLCFVLTGCCWKKPVPAPCPPPPPIQEPEYRTDKLNQDSTIEEVVVALTLDLKEAKATLKRALTILDSYRKPEKKKVEPK